MNATPDEDDTARLLILDQIAQDVRSPNAYAQAFREYHPDTALTVISGLWTKYQGVDRLQPTHDPATGLPRRDDWDDGDDIERGLG